MGYLCWLFFCLQNVSPYLAMRVDQISKADYSYDQDYPIKCVNLEFLSIIIYLDIFSEIIDVIVNTLRV